MKNKNKQKGITLIALIITIIILLILAGISIKALTNTGLFGKANEAKIRTEISQLEEEANLIYTSKLMDNYLSDVSMSDIVSQLQAEGYEIYSVLSDGSAITGIKLDNSSISISKDGTATINVTYEGISDSVQYYAVIKGKYYLMTKTSSGIQISKEASNVDGDSSSDTLTASSSDTSYVTVGTISGNTITLNGISVGKSTITVSYGSHTATCIANVVVTPTDTSVADSTTSFSTEYGTIDVIWLDTSNNVISSPNSPANALTANGESLKPVVFNETNSSWEEVDKTSSSWYDYSNNKWANAMTANDSYFVWIPRYAYRITYYAGYTEDSNGNYIPTGEPTGYYDGWGMWKASDGALKYSINDEEGKVETVDYDGNKYIVHPAFETNLEMGGWSSDLSGFWCAKFEISGTGTTLTSTYGTESTRAQTIGTQYTSARQATYGYTGTEDTDGNTSFMYSHMMKNSEWGAVAYLTHSKYGRNGTEITVNGGAAYYRGGGTDTAYITNVAQSTTGNVYGIYDMSGGSWERTACFNSVDSNGDLSNYGWTTATGLTVASSSTKYATKYNNDSGSSNGATVQYVYSKVGDAIKEVYTGSEAWFADNSRLAYSSFPFFYRGGPRDNYINSGVFCSTSVSGVINYYISFRTVLCP